MYVYRLYFGKQSTLYIKVISGEGDIGFPASKTGFGDIVAFIVCPSALLTDVEKAVEVRVVREIAPGSFKWSFIRHYRNPWKVNSKPWTET